MHYIGVTTGGTLTNQGIGSWSAGLAVAGAQHSDCGAEAPVCLLPHELRGREITTRYAITLADWCLENL